MTRRNISLLLFAATWLAAVAFEDGDLSSWDTANRLQVTRWIWTEAPQVVPEQKWFGIRGKNGERYAWTGLGQSLWMLPSQVVASLLAPHVSDNPKFSQKFEEIFVTYTVFPLTSALAVMALFYLFVALGFCDRTAGLAAMAGFWGTSLFPYTQINQENSLIFLFSVLSFYFLLKAQQEGSNLWWYVGLGSAVGFNFLVRVTTVFDAFCVLLLWLWIWPRPGSAGWKERTPGILLAGACALVFVMVERGYNFFRFGSWVNTYVDVMKAQRPDVLPEASLAEGLPGLLWSIQSNVWQFDPLAAFVLLALPFLWGQLPTLRKKMAVITVLYVFFYIFFYASRPFFDGDSAWGSRYTTSPIILLGALGVAIVLESSNRWLKKAMIPVAVLAVLIQLSSTFFWYSLEEVQQKDHKGISKSMVVLRAQNIAAYWTGRWVKWDLLASKDSERQRTPNYFPFLSAKYFPRPVVAILTGGWALLLVLAIWFNGTVFLGLKKIK